MELSDEQAIRFARFAQAAARVEGADGFEQLVEQHVGALLPHGMLLAVIGQRRFDHLHIRHRIGVRYPPWLLQRIPDDINIRERPVIERWLGSRQAEVIDLPADRERLSPREIQEIESLGLGRLAVHGVPDLSGAMASYFSFAQVPVQLERPHIMAMLNLLCPLLHVALCRLSTPMQAKEHAAYRLTSIERELLGWLAAGRSNQEIAQLRGRSPATIRNQLDKLYGKLQVGSRAEAVALVLSEGRL